jgi:tetrapyrrole methylase family protein/MazG family protein
MCRYLIDEAYELQDAARDGDPDACLEEMGDVLFLLLSCGLILEEQEHPGLEEIAARTEAKIVRRHPHVFADRSARSAEEGVRHWRDMKARETEERGERLPRLLDKIPRSLPPLRRAHTVQRQVASVGFEWETAGQVHEKIIEEAEELRDVLAEENPSRIEEELGDMLFSVVNYARFLGVDPESALHTTVTKFTQRFGYVEDQLRAQSRSLEEATLQEMDALWEEAKTRNLNSDPEGRSATE